MTKFDRVSSLFWVGAALFICVESIRIGPGSLLNPGPGFLPLGAGLLIGIFGGIIFTVALRRPVEGNEVLWEPGAKVAKVVSTITSVLAYAFLIDYLGFHLITLLWIGFVCWRIGDMGWKGAVITSLLTTFSSYLLFERYLGIHFSKGVFGSVLF
jgi:hypothetical protein